ncbi:hypothetical protein [uncultured Gilliamella sp.]|uniref:hypothetical protein n=1 Tax=uncultured Gilliamella sp. TaxID=1193505 RepID=UPI0025F272F9|nr:hypothetical protein [uncultured Gilliamella sp.]
MSKNKQQLIELACKGDKQALENLLVICQPDIKRFARRTSVQARKILMMRCKLHYGSYIEK